MEQVIASLLVSCGHERPGNPLLAYASAAIGSKGTYTRKASPTPVLASTTTLEIFGYADCAMRELEETMPTNAALEITIGSCVRSWLPTGIGHNGIPGE